MHVSPQSRRDVLVAAALVAMSAAAASVQAQTLSYRGVSSGRTGDVRCVTRAAVTDRASSWAAPLDRLVTLTLPASDLRDALDRVAAAARVELSYSNELLPSGKRTCLALDRVAVGAVLEAMLAGTTLRALVTGTSQIVIAPSRPVATSASREAEPQLLRHASVLDRVVVTGTPDGAPQRGSPFALEVLDGATLARLGVSSLGEALDVAVPGMWIWSGGAGSLASRFGSIRGASSFGESAPKVYLDGIEVANPLLVTQIDPARVERVEVIRGPQGAALYGADAISGVVNILTRHDAASESGMSVQFSSAAGVAATAYAPTNAFVQDHALAIRTGSGRRTLGLGVNVGTVGEYLPGASEQRFLADADVRFVLPSTVLTGTGRFSLQRANAGTGSAFGAITPSLRASTRGGAARATTFGAPDSQSARQASPDSAGIVDGSATGEEMRQYTLGGTATMMPSLRWTHTLILGVDGYRLDGVTADGLSASHTFSGMLAQGQGGADRGTMRARAVGRFDISPRTALALTFAGEQAFTHEVLDGDGLAPVERVFLGFGASALALVPGANPQTLVTRWGNSGGLSAQADLAWHDRLYLVAGGRAERAVGFTDTPQRALLPMLGAAYVWDVHGAVLKVRSAYGTGIRPASGSARGTWIGRQTPSPARSLQPESQTGVEAGADLLLPRGVSMHVTRFDQRASGLIQPVAGSAMYTTASGTLVRRMNYTLESVGAITNRGWELQAQSRVNRLTLTSAMTLVDSRVNQLARAYGGDLRVGDRMLDVPARTYSVGGTWVAARWNASALITRAEDWVGYDRVRLGEVLQDTSRAPVLSGGQLRNFWLNYSGVTRVRAQVSYRVTRDWALMFGGENLLNVQRGAPDNATVTAGRTLTFGLRSGR